MSRFKTPLPTIDKPYEDTLRCYEYEGYLLEASSWFFGLAWAFLFVLLFWFGATTGLRLILIVGYLVLFLISLPGLFYISKVFSGAENEDSFIGPGLSHESAENFTTEWRKHWLELEQATAKLKSEVNGSEKPTQQHFAYELPVSELSPKLPSVLPYLASGSWDTRQCVAIRPHTRKELPIAVEELTSLAAERLMVSDPGVLFKQGGSTVTRIVSLTTYRHTDDLKAFVWIVVQFEYANSSGFISTWTSSCTNFYFGKDTGDRGKYKGDDFIPAYRRWLRYLLFRSPASIFCLFELSLKGLAEWLPPRDLQYEPPSFELFKYKGPKYGDLVDLSLIQQRSKRQPHQSTTQTCDAIASDAMQRVLDAVTNYAKSRRMDMKTKSNPVANDQASFPHEF